MQKNVQTIVQPISVKVGAAGWSYKDWVGAFYPPGIKPADMLSFYTRFFNIIEVNATYYRHLPLSYVNGWLKKTEFRDDFSFILKLHGDFTHSRNYTASVAQDFKKNLDALAGEGKLKGMLMQFPYSFEANNVSFNYLRKLTGEFEEYQRFLEFRHASWLQHDIAENLRDQNNTICVIDQPIMGHATPFMIDNPGKKLYLRLHGRNTEAWVESIENFGKTNNSYEEQSERYNYLYNRGEILEIVVRVREVIKQLQEVIIITNNHPHGNAIINAFEFADFLKTVVGEEPPITTQTTMRKLNRRV